MRPALPVVQAWSWQDGRALIQGLQPLDRGPILLPAGDGDDALALLAAGASEVRAAAAQPWQRALLELKLAAAVTFPSGNLRVVLGLDEPGRRVFLWHYLRDRIVEGRGPAPPALSEATLAFWRQQEPAVRRGIARDTRVEAGLARVRPLLRALASPERMAQDLARPPGSSPVPWMGRRLVAILELGLWPALGAREARARSLRVLDRLRQGGAPLVDWVLLGRFLDPSLGPAILSEPGRQALASRRPSAGLLDGELAPALDQQGPGSLDGLFLGDNPGPALLSRGLRALRPGGRLLLRAARPPVLEAGSALVLECSEELQRLDRSLLPGELWRLVRR